MGEGENVDNDYYIRNVNNRMRTLSLADDIVVKIVDWTDCCELVDRRDVVRFRAAFRPGASDRVLPGAGIVLLALIESGRIVRIEEQYLPMTLKVLTLNLWNTSGPWERTPSADPRVGRPARSRSDRVPGGAPGARWERHRHGRRDPRGDGVPHRPRGRCEDERRRLRQRRREPVADRRAATTIELPRGDRDEGRCAVSITVDAPFGEVSFTSTHLNWKLHDGHSREQQVVALADFVLKRRPRGGFPPIVVGDFNAEPDSAEIRYMCGYQSLDGRSVMFFDAWRVAGDGGPGYTWSNRNAFASIALEPERRIDYIFAGYPVRMSEEHGIGKIETCRVVCDDEVDGVWPSDHYGVYAEFRTEPLAASGVDDELRCSSSTGCRSATGTSSRSTS